MSVPLDNVQDHSTHDAAFGFVRCLAQELSVGRVDLPSFPEVAVRVRRVLADPQSSSDVLARVVGSEPVLAAKILGIANSVSLNVSGQVITNLRTAINRMGYNHVRSASMAFALAQLRNDAKLASVKHYLDDLWERSVLVAASAFVIARNCSKINPDEAMLTGMMHGIGQLYVITRAVDHPGLFARDGILQRIIDDWHAEIGKAIMENWGFSDEMVQAVACQHDLSRDGSEAADLIDIIAIAIIVGSLSTDIVALQSALQGLPAAARLDLNEGRIVDVVREFEEEVSALRKALGA